MGTCLGHLIDAIFDAVSPDACSIFMLDDSLQTMTEYRHTAYKDDRPIRYLSAREGVGQRVLSSAEHFVFFPNMDESNYAGEDFRPSQVQTDGSVLLYPCVLYTAVYDHTGRPLAAIEIASNITDCFTPHTIKITRAISLIAASAMRSARLHEEVRCISSANTGSGYISACKAFPANSDLQQYLPCDSFRSSLFAALADDVCSPAI